MDCPRDALTPPIYIEKSSAPNKGYRPFYCECLFFPVGEYAFEEVLAWSFRINSSVEPKQLLLRLISLPFFPSSADEET